MLPLGLFLYSKHIYFFLPLFLLLYRRKWWGKKTFLDIDLPAKHRATVKSMHGIRRPERRADGDFWNLGIVLVYKETRQYI
jgi:hypothetical protein